MPVLALIAAGWAGMVLLGITCPIKFFTGVSCPGCGMTRACLAALRLDLAAAFAYHPLFWTVPLIALGWLFDFLLPRKWVSVAACVLLVLFLAVYVLRLFRPEDTVVVFAPWDGILPRTFRLLVSTWSEHPPSFG